MENERLVRPAEFMNRLGIKKSKFYDSVKNGRLPQPVRLTKTLTAWPESKVNEIISAIKSGELCL